MTIRERQKEMVLNFLERNSFREFEHNISEYSACTSLDLSSCYLLVIDQEQYRVRCEENLARLKLAGLGGL